MKIAEDIPLYIWKTISATKRKEIVILASAAGIKNKKQNKTKKPHKQTTSPPQKNKKIGSTMDWVA